MFFEVGAFFVILSLPYYHILLPSGIFPDNTLDTLTITSPTIL